MILLNLFCTKEIFFILLKAEYLAIKFNSFYIEPIHILSALCLTKNLFSFLFLNKNIKIDKLINSMLNEINFRNYKFSKFKLFSIRSLNLLNKSKNKNRLINSIDLIFYLIQEDNLLINKLIFNLKLQKIILLKTLNNYIKNLNLNNINIINKYTNVNLFNNLSNLVDRDIELNNIIKILIRKFKSNPLLIGEIGVGRRSLIKLLFKKIKFHKISKNLKFKEIKILDLSVLLTTSINNNIEHQLKLLIESSKNHGNLILICLDIHLLLNIFSKQNENSNISSLNLFKIALESKFIQIIGITTSKIYNKELKNNYIIENFFETVIISEPNEIKTFEILKQWSKELMQFHNVNFWPKILKQSIILSKKYLKSRVFPLKALEVLDIACTKIYNKKWKILNNLKIKQAISDLTGIPESILIQNNNINEKLKSLEYELKRNIYGQDKALTNIITSIKRAYTGLKQLNRPVGSWIFWGPSGTGKTELAKIIAKLLFGSEKEIIKFDMSEFMEKHSISRLIGSPPGYIGYGEGGQLTEIVNKKPYSVILFDEIEKAHEDITNLMLQILDDGILTDSTGKKIDFSNTIIIFTSNLGCPKNPNEFKVFEEGKLLSKHSYNYLEINIKKVIHKYFKPEFLNRIDEIIVFNPLTIEILINIAEKFINQLQQQLLVNNSSVFISVDLNIKHFLAILSYHPFYGARPLKKLIEKLIEKPLSELLLNLNLTKFSYLLSFIFDKKFKEFKYSIKKIKKN
uniref:ATP-dependent Clp protease ATP-binding subunit n=1 Tax=Nephromyces sp. ex Molgula occidentalis TaxID=2544991 RepID=A0A5C1H7U8_9APIC|nr:ATP-dependent Clp protease ATP-binding subunit [Nephromyces sp. ex Molgula occidentalis]